MRSRVDDCDHWGHGVEELNMRHLPYLKGFLPSYQVSIETNS